MQSPNRSRSTALTAFLLSALALGGCESQPPAPAEVIEAQEVTATVAALDQATRLITLRAADGTEFTFTVDEAVKNLPQVQVGDQVTLTYYAGLAAEVTEANPEDEVGSVSAGAVSAMPGERPAALGAATISAVVVIEKVDTRNNTVTFRGADGLVRMIDVRRPEMQAFIKGLKKGDKVRLTYAEAVAVEVTPAGAG